MEQFWLSAAQNQRKYRCTFDSKTTIDSSFPSAQSHLECIANPKRLNRNANGDVLLFCITEDIPLTLLMSDLRRKKMAPLQLL